ncbi:hypothetical protein CL689_02345 [Candidatus Saccharibacteria bacterium]|nr:hypothetical protein [Candidatus Saccharibacteria bacterium]|tara:strand:+ start:330 stop:1040 length:711 start_codon:yes stop_codon:yes gene_type:complete
MKVTTTIKKAQDNEIRLTHYVDGEPGKPKEVVMQAMRRTGETGEWEHLTTQPTCDAIHGMTVNEYLEHGRPTIYKHLTPGEILKAGAQAVALATQADRADLAAELTRLAAIKERREIKFPLMVDGFEVNYRIHLEQEISKVDYFCNRLGYTQEEWESIQDEEWFRVTLSASRPGQNFVLGAATIKACSAPDAVEFVTRDQAGGNLEQMIKIAVNKAKENELNSQGSVATKYSAPSI